MQLVSPKTMNQILRYVASQSADYEPDTTGKRHVTGHYMLFIRLENRVGIQAGVVSFCLPVARARSGVASL
jgi:hypothetical protein